MNKIVSPQSVGLTLSQDKNGHWSVWRKDKRISGPLFNRPEVRKKVTKGKIKTIIRHNPASDNPIDFIVN
jgi:hypothetical protein